MPLSNSQYDEIFREYDAKQLKTQHLLETRTKEVYEKSPELKALDASIAECSVASARRLLDGDTAALQQLKAQIASCREKRKALLSDLGYPENYLEPVYTCPDCKDTGYIGTKRCHCFLQRAIDLIYTQSNIKEILEKENFSTFSFDYYSDHEINPATGLSSLATAREAYRICKEFIDTFDTDFSNLCFFGDTGIGKTFLSNCIAKELLDSGHSVIYFTAFQLFDILSKRVFDKDEDAIAAHQNIFDCDLLIIDDLGAELSNQFTAACLYNLINTRQNAGKSCIINTNLTLNEIEKRYSQRIFSRLCGQYQVLQFTGRDVRMMKLT